MSVNSAAVNWAPQFGRDHIPPGQSDGSSWVYAWSLLSVGVSGIWALPEEILKGMGQGHDYGSELCCATMMPDDHGARR